MVCAQRGDFRLHAKGGGTGRRAVSPPDCRRKAFRIRLRWLLGLHGYLQGKADARRSLRQRNCAVGGVEKTATQNRIGAKARNHATHSFICLMLLGNVFDKGPNHPYRILCIGAHSDDIEIGLGGTILRLREAYPQAEWMWAVLSGSGSPREQEAEAGFRIFTEGKNGSLVIKGFRDGFFPVEFGEIKSFFESDLKKFAPDLIFTHYREDRHQDH